MNRRQFGLRAAALVATPLLPALPARTAAAPLSGTAARIYPWAAQYARTHGSASAARIARVFQIAPEAAAQVAEQLVAKGITAAPVAGVAKAVNPISWKKLYSAPTPAKAALTEQLKKLADHLPREAPIKATEAESEPTPEGQSTD